MRDLEIGSCRFEILPGSHIRFEQPTLALIGGGQLVDSRAGGVELRSKSGSIGAFDARNGFARANIVAKRLVDAAHDASRTRIDPCTPRWAGLDRRRENQFDRGAAAYGFDGDLGGADLLLTEQDEPFG